MAHPTRACSDREPERLDVLLLGALLGFAFLASSFLETDGDFWCHLAQGRRLALAPFSLRNTLLPPGIFDLALYSLFRATGGIVLVVLKAMGFTVLAWLLLPPRARRTDSTTLVACILLALLTLVPYASLRPAILSYFFLALTLRLLLSLQLEEAASRSGRNWNRCILLGPLFVLWVNLDRWFWLGPLLVFLFWMGERLEGILGGSKRKTDATRSIPAWLPLACGFACLLNPLGIHVFSLPPGWLAQPWWSASPWQPVRLAASIQQRDLAALAYPLLVVLGLVSLVLPGVQQRSRRVLVWGSLALLSSWQSAMVPFFALVAAPLTALNWQDRLRQRADNRLSLRTSFSDLKYALLNRWVPLAGSIVLIFLAAIGGLHGLPRGQIVPGWGVDADPSPRQFAQTIHRWRQQERLRPDDRLLALPREQVAYFAWFAPEEKPAEEPYRDLRAMEAACRSGKGNLVVVDDPELLRELACALDRWFLVHVEGRITLWGWKASYSNRDGPQPFAVNRLVFAPGEESSARSSSLPDPTLHNYSPAGSLLDRLAPRPGPLGPESEAARTYLRYFQAGVLPLYQRNRLQSWSAYAASLTAPSSGQALSQILLLEQSPLFLCDGEKDLPAFPLLAIRAARRALDAHPDDANAYFCLGQAYRFLWKSTEERSRSRTLSLLAELRQTQAVAALEQAVRLDPNLQSAHQLLAEVYQEQGYLDVALDHRRDEVRVARNTGCRRGETQKAFAQRLQRLEQQTRVLEGMVRERQKNFAALPASVAQPCERAAAALRLGLAKQALDDILLSSSPVLLESSGVNMELELLLRLGRIEQLREWMQGKDLQTHGDNLGLHNLPAPALPGYASAYRLPAACWFRFLWAAARGDYECSQGQLREIRGQMESVRQEQLRSLRRSLALTVANEILLSAQPQLLLLQLLGRKDRMTATHLLNPLLSFSGARADLCVLAGLLALEQGNTRQAEGDFEMALGIRQDFAARPLAEIYLQRLRATQSREHRSP